MKTFIVLGMHRSATSLVSKGLNNHIFFGDDMIGPGIHNKFGHYEDKDFLWMNNRILKEAGGSWLNPPPEVNILNLKNKYAKEIKALIAKKERRANQWLMIKKRLDEPMWGWKDPRTTLTIKLYLPHLTSPHFICCFRDPKEVANSLMKRDANLTYNKCLNLANTYNQRLTSFLQEHYS